jgi:hypothetical protein
MSLQGRVAVSGHSITSSMGREELSEETLDCTGDCGIVVGRLSNDDRLAQAVCSKRRICGLKIAKRKIAAVGGMDLEPRRESPTACPESLDQIRKSCPVRRGLRDGRDRHIVVSERVDIVAVHACDVVLKLGFRRLVVARRTFIQQVEASGRRAITLDERPHVTDEVPILVEQRGS